MDDEQGQQAREALCDAAQALEDEDLAGAESAARLSWRLATRAGYVDIEIAAELLLGIALFLRGRHARGLELVRKARDGMVATGRGLVATAMEAVIREFEQRLSPEERSRLAAASDRLAPSNDSPGASARLHDAMRGFAAGFASARQLCADYEPGEYWEPLLLDRVLDETVVSPADEIWSPVHADWKEHAKWLDECFTSPVAIDDIDDIDDVLGEETGQHRDLERARGGVVKPPYEGGDMARFEAFIAFALARVERTELALAAIARARSTAGRSGEASATFGTLLVHVQILHVLSRPRGALAVVGDLRREAARRGLGAEPHITTLERILREEIAEGNRRRATTTDADGTDECP